VDSTGTFNKQTQDAQLAFGVKGLLSHLNINFLVTQSLGP
jgi:hypothetical protein